jgi:hypothetical protein
MRNYVSGTVTIDNKKIDPPDYLKELFRLYEQRMQLTYGTPEYDAHIRKEKDFYHKNVPAVPLIEKSVLPLPISNRLGNIPTGGYQITTLMISEHLYVK